MSNIRKIVYSDDLLEIIQKSNGILQEIKLKLNSDDLINKGLFLMATTYFEATLRDVISEILNCIPQKLKRDSFTLSKDDLCNSDDYRIRKTIIDNELFSLFIGSVKEQLLYIMAIVSNVKIENIKNRSKSSDVIDIINKCSDISIYRNSLIHSDGKPIKNFNEMVSFYNHSSDQKINFDKTLIINFINDYLVFFNILIEKILKNIEFKQKTKIEQIKQLWNDCFNSPMLVFDKYWEIDERRDLVTNIKYPECENYISSSEKVYLSIWRHQFYDSIKTEEFLLCSINSGKIYRIYEGLNRVKFYYMYQQAHDNN